MSLQFRAFHFGLQNWQPQCRKIQYYPFHLNCHETIRKLVAVNRHILKRIMRNGLNYQTIFDIFLDYYPFTHYKTYNKQLKHNLTIRNLELCHTMYICAAHDYHHKTKNILLTGTNSSISTFEMEGFLCDVSKIHPVNCHGGSRRGVEVQN